MGTIRPKLYLARGDLDVRFIVIKKCIRAARGAGWSAKELSSFCAVAAELEPSSEGSLMAFVRQQFDVSVVL